jgi:TPR repeat protein
MRLGQIYGEGELVEPDPAQSLFWYELAAKNGHAPAQIKLSEIYMQQTPPDYEKSYEWQEKAMKQLFPESPDLLAVSPKLRELKELIDNAKQSQTPAPDIKNEND